MARFGDLECDTPFIYNAKIYIKAVTVGDDGRISYGNPMPWDKCGAIPLDPSDDVEPVGILEIMNVLDMLIHNRRASTLQEIPKRMPPYRKFLAMVGLMKNACKNSPRSVPMERGRCARDKIRMLFGCRATFISAGYSYLALTAPKRRDFRLWAERKPGLTQAEIEERIRQYY